MAWWRIIACTPRCASNTAPQRTEPVALPAPRFQQFQGHRRIKQHRGPILGERKPPRQRREWLRSIAQEFRDSQFNQGEKHLGINKAGTTGRTRPGLVCGQCPGSVGNGLTSAENGGWRAIDCAIWTSGPAMLPQSRLLPGRLPLDIGRCGILVVHGRGLKLRGGTIFQAKSASLPTAYGH